MQVPAGLPAPPHVPRERKPVEVAANRLGLVVNELTAEQKKELKLNHGLVVTEVKQDARAEVRRGDILLSLVHKGRHNELKSVEQFNQLLDETSARAAKN